MIVLGVLSLVLFGAWLFADLMGELFLIALVVQLALHLF